MKGGGPATGCPFSLGRVGNVDIGFGGGDAMPSFGIPRYSKVQ